MSRLNSLDDLFIHELRDLYSAEIQLVEALAKMSEAALSPELKAVLVEHLDGTVDQLNRLEHLFQLRCESPKGKRCSAIEGLYAECRELIEELKPSSQLDAALVALAQKAEHYEIAGYSTAVSYASILGDTKAEEALRETLEEEKEVAGKLAELVSRGLNVSGEPLPLQIMASAIIR
jgi:ferritin-like metal-binding protein YciE